MLTVDLVQLGRTGSVVVEGEWSGDDELWHDLSFSWVGQLVARFRATYAGTGEVVVRGHSVGRLRQACRRCLESVETSFKKELTMVFVADPSGDEDDGGAVQRRGAAHQAGERARPRSLPPPRPPLNAPAPLRRSRWTSGTTSQSAPRSSA